MKSRISRKLARARSLALSPSGRYKAPPLTVTQIKAAGMVAAGKPPREIVAVCACNKHQLARWKKLPRFIDEMQRQNETLQERVRASFISTRAQRVERREEIFQGLVHVTDQRVKHARKDPQLAAQGGLTGLIVEKGQYDTRGNLIQTSYQLDHATITQMLSLMREQAQDLGQWGAKTEVSRSDGSTPVADLRVLLEPVSVGKAAGLPGRPKVIEAQAQEI